MVTNTVKTMAGTKIVDDDERIKLYFNDRVEGDFRPRSIFMDGDTIVMEGLPHPIEYVYGDVPFDIEKYVNLHDYVVCVSKEGTSILVFWHVDKWYVSTHKRLDSFRSYWADKNNTFGRSFAMGLAKAAEQPLDQVGDHVEYVSKMCDEHLDKTRKYIFMLPARYTERIGTIPISEWPRPVQTLVMDDKFKVIEKAESFPGVFEPKVHLSRYRMDVLLDMVKHCDYNDSQGYYIRRFGHSLQTKIYNRTYHNRVEVRGNRADLKFAYMFCRLYPRQADLFVRTYPEFDWRELENEISDTCSDILELERGSRRVIPFEYNEFVRILSHTCRRDVTFRNLLDLTKTAPIVFNRVMNARKKAIRQQQYAEETEQVEDDTNQDMFDQMDALEQFEYTIGTRSDDTTA